MTYKPPAPAVPHSYPYTVSLIKEDVRQSPTDLPDRPQGGAFLPTQDNQLTGTEPCRGKAPSFLQSAFWADFKAAHGWKALRLKLCLKDNRTETERLFEISVLLRSFKRFFTLAYIPMGPVLPIETAGDPGLCKALWIETANALKPLFPKNTLCLRMDVPLDFYSIEERQTFCSALTKPLYKAVPDIQPPDTHVLDLTLSESELLAKMKSKWRYNVNLAAKRGVIVEKTGADGIDIFYDLYLQTAKRDGIAVHSKSYYRDLLLRSGKNGVQITMYIAKHEGEALAAIIVLVSGADAVYLYGASSNNKRNLMSAYLLQWNAICGAKKAGCTNYDFYGIPPSDDEKHPMHGLYRFKTGFGGFNIHRPGSMDIPLSPLYHLFRTAEMIRNFYYKRIKKIGIRFLLKNIFVKCNR